MISNEIVVIRDLTKVYKKPFAKPLEAISSVTFSIQEGEIFGFLGPNGAGKTTTLKILAGLLHPTRGKAWIFGKPIDEIAHRQKIGFLPEHPSFYEHLSGRELLCFYGSIFGLGAQRLKKAIDAILDLVGLTEAQHMRIGSYSKGMIQRIGIAQSLVNDPELVILDEPLSGLDPTGRKKVKDIVLSLKREGKTIFFSTHILADVEKICDRIAVLHQGKLIKVGSLDTLLKKEVQSNEITLENVSEKDGAALRKLTGKMVMKEKRAFLTVDSGEALKKLQDVVCGSECRIVSIIPQLPTLEEYFSQLVLSEEQRRPR